MQERLDAMEQAMGLPASCPVAVVNLARELLSMPPEEVRRLTPEECEVGAFTLLQMAFYLQRAVNRHQSRVRYCEECVKRMLAPKMSQYHAYSYDERWHMAMNENAPARELEQARVEAQLKLDRVSYLSGRCEAMARELGSMYHTKRGNRH